LLCLVDISILTGKYTWLQVSSRMKALIIPEKGRLLL